MIELWPEALRLENGQGYPGSKAKGHMKDREPIPVLR